MDASCGLCIDHTVARQVTEREDTHERVAYRISLNSKPLPAAERMTPTLKRVSARVFTRKEIIGPLLIGQILRLLGSGSEVRATEGEFVFVSCAATKWAWNA
jgi:hypothetical protein